MPNKLYCVNHDENNTQTDEQQSTRHMIMIAWLNNIINYCYGGSPTYAEIATIFLFRNRDTC